MFKNNIISIVCQTNYFKYNMHELFYLYIHINIATKELLKYFEIIVEIFKNGVMKYNLKNTVYIL